MVSACWRAMAGRSIAAPPTGVKVSRQSTPISIGPMIEKAWMRGSPGPHLAARLGALDQAGDQTPTPFSDDVVVPDPGELGEVARFADHHLHHRADRRAVAISSAKRGRSIRSRSANGTSSAATDALDRLDIGDHRLADDGAEDVLLGLEIEIERALGDAGAGRDLLDPRAGKALFGEHAAARPRRCRRAAASLRRRHFGCRRQPRTSLINDRSVINTGRSPPSSQIAAGRG